MSYMSKVLTKSIIFTIVTVLITAVLAGTIRNSVAGTPDEYTAVFSDVTSLHDGDEVRVSGVKVGTVDSIEVTENRLAEVTFSVSDDVDLRQGTIAEMRFRNLIGQRYINLDLADSGPQMKPGDTFSLDETKDALDLTMLFNGFRPLFKMLNPEDVNRLSSQIVAVFQGEGTTVETLLDSTASLTSTLADKDKVIGELIDHLNSVLEVVNSRTDELDTTISTLQRLVSGLAEDRHTIGSTIDGLGDLTVSVADLLDDGRKPLKGSINALGRLSKNLGTGDYLDDFLKKLPVKLNALGRLGSYGSWLNFYVCRISGDIPDPEGYMGQIGVNPVAQRCLR